MKDRAAGRAQLDRMIDWDAQRIVLAHGEIIASEGTDVLRAAYSWL